MYIAKKQRKKQNLTPKIELEFEPQEEMPEISIKIDSNITKKQNKIIITKKKKKRKSRDGSINLF